MSIIAVDSFVPDQSAAEVSACLKKAVRAMDQARHCAVLWFKEIVERELYKELGYGSVYQYAAVELEFSKTRTGDFLHLARKLEKLPRLKKEMEEGKIGYTKAREIVKVADEENEDRWLNAAKKKSRQELRETVKRAKQRAKRERVKNPAQGELLAGLHPTGALPVALTHKVTFELTSEQLAHFEALVEAFGKQGGAVAGSGRAIMLLEAMASLVGRADSGAVANPKEPHTQIHVHHCPDCEKSHITTSRGETELTPSEYEKLACDAHVATVDGPNKSAIPPSTRRRVLARDQHRCQAPGCSHTRFLEIHHIIPRSEGGTNAEENLTTLCSACHQRAHDKQKPACGKNQQAGPKTREARKRD
ncbi:hypothetical protein CSB20_00150 [bacterium DOLZORAL124_64_63]|nr:MAG: hypothetical protein CSB20_00150 [bacterium DOLZORAL124_64_63]